MKFPITNSSKLENRFTTPAFKALVKFPVSCRSRRSACRSSFGRDFRSLDKCSLDRCSRDKCLPVGFDHRFLIPEYSRGVCTCDARRGAVIPDMCLLLRLTRCPAIRECPECIHRESPGCRDSLGCLECLECPVCRRHRVGL